MKDNASSLRTPLFYVKSLLPVYPGRRVHRTITEHARVTQSGRLQRAVAVGILLTENLTFFTFHFSWCVSRIMQLQLQKHMLVSLVL